MKFGTKAIHAGQEADPSTGAIMTPIYQTSTYIQESPGKHKGYEYARTQNPTRTALEANLAALEEGKYGIVFASGMASTDAIIKLLRPGDHVLSVNDLYGGTFRLFERVYRDFGLDFDFVDLHDAGKLSQHLKPNTKMLWLETPTNPMLNVVDIKALAEEAHKHDVIVVVDNTFSTPYLQQPLELGADIVTHSLTKYMGGHSDVIMGAAITKRMDLAEKLSFLQNGSGAVPGPSDVFLVLRGIKTLHLRMKAHSENGEKVAHYLQDHPKVAKVYWPGFENHPGHEVAKRQMRHFGGMVSFTLKEDTEKAAFTVLERFKVFTLAESLGGVESLVGHPATMTHASIPVEKRHAVGLTDSLIRLSVGVEDIEDLLDDLKQALD